MNRALKSQTEILTPASFKYYEKILSTYITWQTHNVEYNESATIVTFKLRGEKISKCDTDWKLDQRGFVGFVKSVNKKDKD